MDDSLLFPVLSVLAVVLVFVRPLDMIRTWNDKGPAQRVPMTARVTDSGLRVYVPRNGDQSWDSDQPSTPYFVPRLRLRVEADMARGFTRRSPGTGGGGEAGQDE